MSTTREQNIVWLDMEMTGLDPTRDTIIEIATIITDSQLNILAEGPELIINQSADLFKTMDDWNRKQHTESGLWRKVIESKISLTEAEDQTLQFVKIWTEEKKNYLAGNSIWQDRRFIIPHMPKLDKHLNYRMIDVTTVKALSTYWHPQLKFVKKGSHRALDDIKESIEELRFYRKWSFNPQVSASPIVENSSLVKPG